MMIRFPITGGISDIRKKLTAEPMVFPDLRAIIAQKLSAAIKPMNIIVKASLIHYPRRISFRLCTQIPIFILSINTCYVKDSLCQKCFKLLLYSLYQLLSCACIFDTKIRIFAEPFILRLA